MANSTANKTKASSGTERNNTRSSHRRPRNRTNPKKGAKNDEKSVKLKPEGESDDTDAEDSSEKKVSKVTPVEEEDDEDGEFCFICAQNVTYMCIMPCNHQLCHVCALRLRALYKTNNCTFCKTAWDQVLFVNLPVKETYNEYDLKSMPSVNKKYGIVYETEQIKADSEMLLQYNCPDPDCDTVCTGWFDLKLHCKTQHHKLLCDLCTRNKKVFTHEHTLFSKNALTKHHEVGDKGKELEVTGFKGHPKCEFCKAFFYDEDELFKHCREKHEKCHVCDQLAGRPVHQYFRNYESLEKHFEKDHFVCREKVCLERKFVVFGTDIDLKAHQLEEHPQSLTSREMREVRRIVPEFSYDVPGSTNRRSRNQNQSSSTQPISSTEAIAESLSNVHLSREEMARLRQEEYMREQQARNQSFGFGLTSAPTPRSTARVVASSGNRRNNALRSEDFPSLDSLNQRNQRSGASTPSATASHAHSPVLSRMASPSPMAMDVKAQHQQIIDRILRLTNNNENALSEFKFAVSSYRGDVMSAEEMLNRIGKLVPQAAEHLSPVINQLSSLFENEEKGSELIRAWNNWRAKHGIKATNQLTNTTILRMKQGGRNTLRTASVWNRIEKAASKSPVALSRPSSSATLAKIIPSASAGSNRRPVAAPRTSWGVRAANPSTLRSTSEADFPSLPPATQKRIPIALGKKAPRSETFNSWSPGGKKPAASSSSSAKVVKKNKKKQTVLFHLG
ncbi:ubiquitin-protein ligase E3 [Schizosaccharomyces japonicus yFS275]|uniref:RING-type E3 ubiquitin transferase n=1 Tax=Schizosaccharomyces japonicus (strain yFS275 / FY16936) TaxID=402676 RepID=B6K124_SCHJY|nr:ubiquitin-protein ligase E3 [Schizosaccharomyces japonicus yFS275]EEB07645.1 ubiquitin-protein ligase E3 [Schizosaccharomyces japonicus yFS275]